MSIHATAVVHPKAELHSSVSVGPYSVIEEGVRIGEGCLIGPHVHLVGNLEIGAGCRFHAGAVVGDAPQDLKYQDEPTWVRIGSDNIFREHVTVHRSNTPEEDTVIGAGNFFMAHSHVGHNARIGDSNTLVNGALIGGHVIVEDRVLLAGNCGVHQFVRVGTLAMIQGGAGLSKDLPPFMMSRALNTVCGLNSVGLRRAGFTIEERTELKQLYRHLYSGKLGMSDAVIQGMELFTSPPSQRVLSFVQASKRGVCRNVLEQP
jgi:UDP-N-acetylglucosamine acyltransferase